ncbi:unnamed protein product [Symbiodinium sp. KB8]|nr:unnamed protein product [Symbiodinium sp. KB8]
MNCITLSQHGSVNALLAGGDVDGDLDMISFWPKLVEFLADTEEAVKAWDFKTLEAEALEGQTYLREAQRVKTISLRGLACRFAERIASRAVKALLSGAGQSRLEEAVHEALVAACLAHRAMDAPKKFPVESFLGAMRRMRRKFNLSAKADWLKELDVGRLGHVWVPADTVVLGEEAAEHVVNFVLDGGARGTVLMNELAALCHHKLHRKFGSDAARWFGYTAEGMVAQLLSVAAAEDFSVAVDRTFETLYGGVPSCKSWALYRCLCRCPAASAPGGR